AGRVVETGTIREIYDHPAHPYPRRLLQSIPGEVAHGERLTSIDGAPPNLLDLPAGCAFHPRCPFSDATCRTTVPQLREPGGWQPGHAAACHRSEEVLAHD
ncbi:MAG: oligopeptide/dipeptide ABC transporter ATP-binding protein, partial [Beutenbergiaceae bacterium]